MNFITTRAKPIYFDHAATGFPKDRRVIRRVRHILTKCGGNPGRSAHEPAQRAADEIFASRCAIADFFGADCENVIFTSGATHAINLAMAIHAKPTVHILISDMEHNAVYRTAYRLVRDLGGTLTVFRARDLEDFRQKLQHASLVAATHVSNVTGERLPVEEMGGLCREKGVPFIVDASQSAGHIPVTLATTHASILCVPAHKALGGIQGCGAAIFSERTLLPELFTGGSGSHSLSAEMPTAFPDRYEAGTPPTPAIAAFGEGVSLLTDDRLRRRSLLLSHLVQCAEEGLRAIKRVTIPHTGDARIGILSFLVAGIPSERAAQLLADEGICVRGGLHCAPLAHKTLQTQREGCVRLSFGDSNTEREVSFFLQRAKRLFS